MVMQTPFLDHRETVAGAFIAFAFFTAAMVGFKLLGWFGLGLTGMIALYISTRLELFNQHGDVIDRDVERTVRVKARIDGNDGACSPEERLALIARKARTEKQFRVANTFFGAGAALGLGMFALRVYQSFNG